MRLVEISQVGRQISIESQYFDQSWKLVNLCVRFLLPLLNEAHLDAEQENHLTQCSLYYIYMLTCVLFVSTPCIIRGEKQMFRGPDSSHSNLAKIGRDGS